MPRSVCLAVPGSLALLGAARPLSSSDTHVRQKTIVGRRNTDASCAQRPRPSPTSRSLPTTTTRPVSTTRPTTAISDRLSGSFLTSSPGSFLISVEAPEALATLEPEARSRLASQPPRDDLAAVARAPAPQFLVHRKISRLRPDDPIIRHKQSRSHGKMLRVLDKNFRDTRVRDLSPSASLPVDLLASELTQRGADQRSCDFRRSCILSVFSSSVLWFVPRNPLGVGWTVIAISMRILGHCHL
jgi:hypothetical protein